jgi:hypothetical protein
VTRMLALIIALFTSAPSWAGEPVRVDAPWARATILASRPGAAYLKLVHRCSSARRRSSSG